MNLLTRLLQLLQSAPDTRPTLPRFDSRIERLEGRIAPANIVNTAFAGGTLKITTVDQLDPVAVANGDNAQIFEIMGLGAGNVRVDQVGPTIIDGQPFQLFNGVKNILIDLRLGNDTVTIRGLEHQRRRGRRLRANRSAQRRHRHRLQRRCLDRPEPWRRPAQLRARR